MLVICNGMFRSGSTLQYNLARELLERLGCGTGHGFFDGEAITADRNEIQRWLNDEKLHIVKTHKIPPIVFDPQFFNRFRILYIYRDLRDVAVSLKRRDQYASYSDKKLLQVLDLAVDIFNRVTPLPNALIQQYETLTNDLDTALHEIAGFLNMPIDPKTANHVIHACSIDGIEPAIKRTRLRQKISSSRFGAMLRKWKLLSRTYDSRTLLHGNHISTSRGASVWRVALTTDDANFIFERYKNWFEITGYKAA